ncbi:MAG TPA: RNA polymerase sigma factor [Candidatus Polarisedimenticolia bacterium]|nr:RNA polymerase sigma factor [Candidatus Polarisedimenticolia bacterium]
MSYAAGETMTPSQDSEATPSRYRDQEDVALAARGDVRAFARLYGTHAPRIFNLARRMTSPDTAVDLTQDIFLRAWQKLHTFRGESAFGTWLHRLAVNVILARRSALSTERSRITDDEGALDAVPAKAGRSDLGMDFERAIEHLPDGAKTVFVLYDVEGFQHEEIATMLGISSGTSKAQLHRARMILRRHLTR